MPRTRSLKWSQLKIGLAGILAAVLATALIFAVGGQGGFFWQRYPLHTRFPDVAGLKTGAVVRLNGMEVGKVTRVALAGSQVEVGMEVSRDVRALITSESEASMGTLSLLGEPIVDLRAAPGGAPLPDDGFVRPAAGGGIAALAASAAGGVDEAGRLLADVRAGRGTIGSLFSDAALQEEMNQLVVSAARVARHLERGEGTLGALSRDPGAYRALSSSLQSLDSVAGRLARGEGSAGRLLADPALYDRVAALATRMDQVVSELEAGDGTAAHLLNDRRLYDNLNRVTEEVSGLVADIRKDPKKYLSVELSVF